MELTLDIFDGDAFSAVTMTSYVNLNIPFVPGFLGSLKLAPGVGVYTPKVSFDDDNGSLSLIQSSPRGAPPEQMAHRKGKTRVLETVRLSREATINADEVAGVRVLGTASQLQTAERLVMKRVEGPVGLKAALGYTLEHMYLGMIDGQVYDADGATVLWDYFDTYGVARPAAVDFAFSTATSDGGVIVQTAMDMKRAMIRALNGFSLAGAQIVMLCGDNFFDAAWTSKELVKARQVSGYGNMQAPQIISENKAFSSFRYADVNWVNYRGSDDGAVSVPTDEGRAFMMGVPGLFGTYFAPADTWDFVNTEGLPSYMLQRPERQTSSQRVFEVQSNPLPMCLRPLSLRQATKS